MSTTPPPAGYEYSDEFTKPLDEKESQLLAKVRQYWPKFSENAVKLLVRKFGAKDVFALLKGMLITQHTFITPGARKRLEGNLSNFIWLGSQIEFTSFYDGDQVLLFSRGQKFVRLLPPQEVQILSKGKVEMLFEMEGTIVLGE